MILLEKLRREVRNFRDEKKQKSFVRYEVEGKTVIKKLKIWDIIIELSPLSLGLFLYDILKKFSESMQNITHLGFCMDSEV